MRRCSILPTVRRSAGVVLAVVALTCTNAALAQKSSTFVTGEAYGVYVDLGLLQVQKTPHVMLPPQGGNAEDALLEIDALAVVSQTLHVATSGKVAGNNAFAHSAAVVERVDVLNGLVTAEVALAVSDSIGHTDKGQQNSARLSSSGDGVLVGLTIDGVAMGDVSPPPNTVIEIPKVARIILNEQIPGGDGKTTTSLTVNMIHVEVLDNIVPNLVVGHVIVSSAHSGLKFDLGDDEIGSFVTGGGWVGGMPRGATFGFVAGNRNAGGTHGNLQFTDHADLTTVHTNDIDFYAVDESGLCATFSGPARVNGETGYTVEVFTCDFGEPGAGSDLFWITVFDADNHKIYESGGVLDGGNVQMHSR